MAWPVAPLSECVEQVQRTVRVEPDQKYQLLGMRSKIAGPFLRETKVGAEVSADTLNRVETGDFIYSRLFAWQGSFGVIPPELDGAYVSNEFPIFRIDEERLNPVFLVYWFGLPSTQRIVEADCFGSTPGTRNRFNEGYFLKLRPPLPPVDDQRRIVEVLDKATALVKEVRVLRNAIGDDINSFIISAHESYADTEGTTLGDFIELAEDRVAIDPVVSYPQVGIRGFAGGLFFKDEVLGSETSYKAFNRLSPGLLVVSQPKGWEGAVAVCDETSNGWFASPEYRTFRCRTGLLEPAYLAALLPTPWFQSQLSKLTRGQGARRERLRPDMLLGMSIRMPSLEKQHKALEAIEKLRQIHASKAAFMSSIEALLPAMLHQVFSGAGTAGGQILVDNFGVKNHLPTDLQVAV